MLDEALEQRIADLEERLNKNSTNSSKPPSSDIVKPPKPPPPEGQDRRRIGGQPGHPKHERAAFPPEAVNAGTFDHRLALCPSCGLDLHPTLTIAPRVVQQVDIREVPLSIQEHRSHPGWCPRCRKMYEAPLPREIARGGMGAVTRALRSAAETAASLATETNTFASMPTGLASFRERGYFPAAQMASESVRSQDGP